VSGATSLDPLHQQRKAAEDKLQTTLSRHFVRQKRLIVTNLQKYISAVQQAAKEVQLTDLVAQLLHDDTTSKATQSALANVLQTTLVRSLEVVGRTASDAITDRQFDATSRKIVAKYDPTQFVTDLDKSTANQLTQAFRSWSERGGSRQELIDNIATILPGGPGAATANRASRIAITETSRIYGLTRNEVFKLKGYKQVAWRTDPNERTCSVCAALGDMNQGRGAIASVSNPVFSLDGVAYTIPAHPNCRCHLEPVGPRDDAWSQAAANALDLEHPLGRAVNAGVAFGITASAAYVTQHLPQLVSYIQPEIQRMFDANLYSRDFDVTIQNKDILEQVQDLLDALDASVGFEERGLHRIAVSDNARPGAVLYTGPQNVVNLTRAVANDLDNRLLTESRGLPGSTSSFKSEWLLFRDSVRQSAAFKVYAENNQLQALEPNWSQFFEKAFTQYLRRYISDPKLEQAVGTSFWSYGDFQPIATSLDVLIKSYGLSPKVLQDRLRDPYGAVYGRPTPNLAFTLPHVSPVRAPGRRRGITPQRG
jgi:SPP1 gp7 family putative phage head morphogenesis protein